MKQQRWRHPQHRPHSSLDGRSSSPVALSCSISASFRCERPRCGLPRPLAADAEPIHLIHHSRRGWPFLRVRPSPASSLSSSVDVLGPRIPTMLLHPPRQVTTAAAAAANTTSISITACKVLQSINQSINHYFCVRPKMDQRAGQLSLPQVGITNTERNINIKTEEQINPVNGLQGSTKNWHTLFCTPK